MRKISMVLAGAVALSACAAAPGADGPAGSSTLTTGQCFRGNDVNNFNTVDRKTVYVSTRQGYVYRLDATGDCFSVGMESVAVAPFQGADPRICIGDQAQVSVGEFRAPATPCLARVSGPIRDSSISGLRSRQD
ncbi:MAG: hypothetical protein KKG14_02330 [Alphaproteobacteria bacterium]|nr:hypothetical protein [Alphaproteobacteria bacterium]MBU2269925.1 hypothetical protein [Alphaproteobacteria bacterium]MBU2417521.1 hypothetical protein [Alphaproteobacteria bacterium]